MIGAGRRPGLVHHLSAHARREPDSPFSAACHQAAAGSTFFGTFFFSLSEPIGKFSQGELKQCCLIRMVYFIGDRNRNIPSSNTEDKRKTKEGRAEVSQNTGYTRIR